MAMLFLATKGFPHAAMWANWFHQAGGLLPGDCLTAAVCRAGDADAQAAALNEVLAVCGPSHTTPGGHIFLLLHLCTQCTSENAAIQIAAIQIRSTHHAD